MTNGRPVGARKTHLIANGTIDEIQSIIRSDQKLSTVTKIINMQKRSREKKTNERVNSVECCLVGLKTLKTGITISSQKAAVATRPHRGVDFNDPSFVT